MLLRCLLFLFLMFVGLGLKAQVILLNADSSQIQKEVRLHGVILKKYSIEKDLTTKDQYKRMFFRPLIIPPEGNACLISMTFYLTLKNKCFKYDEYYWGAELADQRIDELKKTYGLKQVKGSLKWINNDKNIEIDLIPKKIGNNNLASAYLLEFKSLNNEMELH